MLARQASTVHRPLSPAARFQVDRNAHTMSGFGQYLMLGSCENVTSSHHFVASWLIGSGIDTYPRTYAAANGDKVTKLTLYKPRATLVMGVRTRCTTRSGADSGTCAQVHIPSGVGRKRGTQRAGDGVASWT